MQQDVLEKLYLGLHIPVVVCEIKEGLPVQYMNRAAELLFSPHSTVEELRGVKHELSLNDMIFFELKEQYDAFYQTISGVGYLSGYTSNIVTFNDKHLSMDIFGNSITFKDKPCFVLYMVRCDQPHDPTSGKELFQLINSALIADDPNASIDMVLAMAGTQLAVDRAYVFEEISATTTRNTYEWCAQGVAPAMQYLQRLNKADYNYEAIVASGTYITDDVSLLPKQDREILQKQGIKALALLTLYDKGKPIGYVGFDDVKSKRVWSHKEIQFLQSISVLILQMLKRRNAEKDLLRSRQILQIISDNAQDLIYVNRLDNYELTYVSKSLAEVLNKDPEELYGEICYKAFGRGFDGPCPYCPIPHLTKEEGQSSEVYTWEYHSKHTNKVYLAKDSLIQWVDGDYVHLEASSDITQQKENEQMLRFFASTDAMTGISNREWGAIVLDAMLEEQKYVGSLVFIDTDALKYINDTYGHQEGDNFLLDCVAIIKSHITEDEFVCRWGGDEFLLWLDQDKKQAEATIGKMQKEMEALNAQGKKLYTLSFSYGIVPFLPGKATLDEHVIEADKRMYENKMEKKNRSKARRRGETY